MFNKKKFFYKAEVDKEFNIQSVLFPSTIVDSEDSHGDAVPPAPRSSVGAAAAAAAAAAPPASASASAGSASTLGAFEPWMLVGNIFTLLNVVLWLLPLGDLSDQGFARASLAVGAVNLMSLYKRHGRPRLSKDYAKLILSDDRAQHCFHLLICSGAKSMLLMLLPHCIRSLIFVARYAPTYVERFLPSMATKMNDACLPVRQSETQMLVQGATFDIYTWFVLVIYLFSGNASILTIVMYAQWLRAKYMITSSSKQAWAQLRHTLDGVLKSDKCPQALTQVYDKVCGWLSSWGEIPRPPPPAAASGEAAATTGGRSCAIM